MYARHSAGGELFCRPVDKRLDVSFSVCAPKGRKPPERGSLLLVRAEHALARDLWRGSLLAAYGREDDARVQEALVKLNHEVPQEFPPEMEEIVRALPQRLRESDLAGREDMRGLPLVTIDGENARDFDDAVHVARRNDGWLLHVAVADVSHYVPSAKNRRQASIDNEARSRGNSWYFPLSVAPMLPEPLSCNLCSLKPGEDRLALLCEIPLSSAGRPGKSRFSLAVMRSAARLTYDQVKSCLLDGDAAALDSLRAQPRGNEVIAMLTEAFRLFTVLRKARLARGALDFDLPEPEYDIAGNGRVRAIRPQKRHDAHRLVEEFMIAANEACARHLEAAGLPFPYRVHPSPDAAHMDDLIATLAATAPECLPPRRTDGQPDAHTLRHILQRARETPREGLVYRLSLRAMPQARYQPANEGHFGLASTAYCHFTSPIRRYADLLVHRALKASLGHAGSPLPAGQKLWRITEQLNRRERAAMECEREMARRLGCLALQGREGEIFDGVITAVTEFGFFVTLSGMPVEGLVHVRDLGRERHAFDALRHCLTGLVTGRQWRMGLRLDIRIAGVNPGRLELRFVPVDVPDAANAAGRQAKAYKRGVRARAGRKH